MISITLMLAMITDEELGKILHSVAIDMIMSAINLRLRSELLGSKADE